MAYSQPARYDLSVTWQGQSGMPESSNSIRNGSLCWCLHRPGKQAAFYTVFMHNKLMRDMYPMAIRTVSKLMNECLKTGNVRLFQWLYDVVDNKAEINWETYGVGPQPKNAAENVGCVTPEEVMECSELTFPTALISADERIALSSINQRIHSNFFKFMGVIKGDELETKGIISTTMNSECDVFDYWKPPFDDPTGYESNLFTKRPGEKLYMYMARRYRAGINGKRSRTMADSAPIELTPVGTGAAGKLIMHVNPNLEFMFTVGVNTVPLGVESGIRRIDKVSGPALPGGAAVPFAYPANFRDFEPRGHHARLNESDKEANYDGFAKRLFENKMLLPIYQTADNNLRHLMGSSPNNGACLVGTFSRTRGRNKPIDATNVDQFAATENSYINTEPTLVVLADCVEGQFSSVWN